MPKGIKKCKICGKEYEYCRSAVPNNSMFRWQDVACCREHGEAYLAKVMEARSPKRVPVIEPDKYDDQDALLEEGFDDSDDEIDIVK